MEVKAADVAKLRKMTGAGMMDCKKALIEAEGDYAKAQDIIREKVSWSLPSAPTVRLPKGSSCRRLSAGRVICFASPARPISLRRFRILGYG